MDPFFFIVDTNGNEHLIRKDDVANVTKLKDSEFTRVYFVEDRVKCGSGKYYISILVAMPLDQLQILLGD